MITNQNGTSNDTTPVIVEVRIVTRTGDTKLGELPQERIVTTTHENGFNPTLGSSGEGATVIDQQMIDGRAERKI